MKIKIIIIILIILMSQSLYARRFARWHTNMGNFTAEIRFDLMPITGFNFIQLAENHFYDNLIFHRVIDDFVIQDGCPLGTGTGGPGYTIEDEYCDELIHDQPGMLAMAKTNQPNSAGSQYYITLAALPHLDGNYAVFGKVFEGLDVVFDIGQVPTNSNDKPIEPVVIDSLRMLSLEINSITPNPNEIIETNNNTIQFIVDALDIFTFEIPAYAWYIDDELIENQNTGIFNTVLNDYGTYNVKCLVIAQDITYPINWTVNYTENVNITDPTLNINKPILLSSYPNPFKTKTILETNIKQPGLIEINIYNIKGQKIKSLINETKAIGIYHYEWDGTDNNNKQITTGIYTIEIKHNNQKIELSKISYIK
ncbi:MAG: peptidylprolyl isomerase [Candidatus Cloacimonetes bacterium]|nr:peptidylprolyl isomerase [Candidatus Cloacimonadota bacterium]